MANLKLGRLPDRTLVKISFQARPDLAGALRAYAELYRETYGQGCVGLRSHPLHAGELPRGATAPSFRREGENALARMPLRSTKLRVPSSLAMRISSPRRQDAGEAQESRSTDRFG